MLRLPDPGLFAVTDRDDFPEHAEFLRELAARETGRLLVNVTPGSDNNRTVGNDVLKALGKDPELHGAGRNGTEMWQRAGLWLELAELEDVVVSRAHLLPYWLLEELVRLAARSGVRLWLIFQTPALKRRQRRFLQLWPVTELEWDEFRSRWPALRKRTPPRAAPSTDTADRLPSVPIDDFTTFRASCRQLLSAEGFAAVDAEFKAAFDSTAAYLRGCGRTVTEDDICAHVRGLIADLDWMPSLITRVRGCQVAAFHAGHLMKVSLDALTASRVRRIQLDDEVVATLATYATPRLVAAAVLVAAVDCQLEDVVTMNVGDVSTGGTVRLAGKTHKLPSAAAKLVEALARERLMNSAEPADPLFVYIPGTGRRSGRLIRWTVQGMYNSVKKVERETGLLLTSHLLDHGQTNAVAWAQRHGISIQRL